VAFLQIDHKGKMLKSPRQVLSAQQAVLAFAALQSFAGTGELLQMKIIPS